MFGLQQKYWVFREITVGATSTKRATYKEQAAKFFKEASALINNNLRPQEVDSSRICAVGWCP
jgi:hypothetical protein